MATSVAVLKYGTYQFSPVPQVGIRSGYTRGGEARTGPAAREKVVTLVGRLKGNNLNEVQAKVNALEVALGKERQNFYYHDGVALRADTEAHILSLDIPTEWGQYEARYTITLSYIPLDDVHKAPVTCSYNGFTFATADGDQPLPIFGREFSIERESPDAARGSMRVQVNLSGFFEEGSITANLSKLNALITALSDDGGTLVYGDFSQTVKIDRFSHAPDIMDRRVTYALTCSYALGDAGGYPGVIKMSSSRRISRVAQRLAKHAVPFLDGSSVQLLGENSQSIQATGFIIAEDMATARAAAQTEIDAQFPANGIEEPNGEITEKASENRVDWSVTQFYTTPALRGGVYGG